MVSGLLCVPTNSLGVPKDERVDPLVTVPALVIVLSKQLPLATPWHLLFEPNYAVQDQLFVLRVLWKVNCFLLYPLLLHYLTEANRVSGNRFISRLVSFLCLKLLGENLHHI